MRIEDLAAFVTYAKCMNVSKAAAKLNMTQSALSKRILAMEKELGFPLITHGQNVQLAPTGVGFLECAQDTLAAYENGLVRCKDLLRQGPPLQLVWFDDSHWAPLLATLDGLRFVIRPITGNETYFSELVSGRADLVAMCDVSLSQTLRSSARANGIEVTPAGECDAAFAVAASHPLASKPQITREDLLGAKIALTNGACFDEWGAFVSELLGPDLNLSFDFRSVNGNLANLQFLDFGQSVFFMSRSIIEQYCASRSDIVIFTDLDGKPLKIPMAILTRKDDTNPGVSAFLNHARITYARA